MSPKPFVLMFDDPENGAPPGLALNHPPPLSAGGDAVTTSTAASIDRHGGHATAERHRHPNVRALRRRRLACTDCVGETACRVSPIRVGRYGHEPAGG